MSARWVLMQLLKGVGVLVGMALGWFAGMLTGRYELAVAFPIGIAVLLCWWWRPRR